MELLSPSWMHELIRAYGLWVLFIVIMLESTGVPMPGETALVTAALYAGSTHQISLTSIVLAASIAAIFGDNIGYLIGRSIGIRLIVRYGSYVRLNHTRLKVGQYLFLRHSGKIVFFGRFVAILRTYAAMLAGINRMPWRLFLAMNALGGVCWALVFGVGAYLLGGQFERIAGPVSFLLFCATMVMVVAGMFFYRHHEKELERRAEAALTGSWPDSVLIPDK
jgi:membrane protein DedA with SNARE-associated domain